MDIGSTRQLWPKGQICSLEKCSWWKALTWRVWNIDHYTLFYKKSTFANCRLSHRTESKWSRCTGIMLKKISFLHFFWRRVYTLFHRQNVSYWAMFSKIYVLIRFHCYVVLQTRICQYNQCLIRYLNHIKKLHVTLCITIKFSMMSSNFRLSCSVLGTDH